MPDIIGRIGPSIDTLTREFSVIASNLANVSTTGYKRRCSSFSESLKAQDAATKPSSGNAADSELALDFSQGGMVATGQPLDFALHGKGFFVIETPNGPLYTRNGTFSINKNNQIVDSSRNIVAGDSGPLVIPPETEISQLSVTSDGSILAGKIPIGRFKLVDFKDNQNKLIPVGESCFSMTDSEVRPAAAENLVVKQGYQESSNVKMVNELVDMITVSRLYEANMKFISSQAEASNNLMNVAMG